MAIAVCCLSLILLFASETTGSPKVELTTGSAIGVAETFNHAGVHREVYVYKGLPYAEPPVGELRFQQPATRARWDGEWNATYFRCACIQKTGEQLSVMTVTDTVNEDCLYLNVYAPQGRTEPTAVMVWFHGGGLVSGSASMAYYDGIPLAAIGDVIVVTVNYRLGALGFLSTGDDVLPGNIGLYDQRKSLVWVQDNIAAFGGDPNRVTIFGFSSGAASVGFHLLSPLSSSLFHRGILQSGSPTTSWLLVRDPSTANRRAHALGKLLGCDRESSKELISCLKDVPAEEFIDPSLEMPLISEITREADTVFPFYATIDGHFVADNVKTMLKKKSINKRDIMLGFSQDEASSLPYSTFPEKMNQTSLFVNRSEFDVIFDTYVPPVRGIPILKELVEYQYFDKDELEADFNYADILNEIITDEAQSCTIHDMSHAFSDAGQRVFLYFFPHHPSKSIYGDIPWMKAAHGELQQYVFGFHFMKDMDWSLTEDEVEMTLQVMKYWSNFAKTGDPNVSENGEEVTESDGSKFWPAYSKPDRRYKTIIPQMPNNRSLREKECVFWNDLLPRLKEYVEHHNVDDHERRKYSEEWNGKETI